MTATPTPDGAAVVERRWRSPRPLQLAAVLGVFRRGAGDPTYAAGFDGEIALARHTPQGPATIELSCRPRQAEVLARAWGPGASWAAEQAPALVGDSDDWSGFQAHHRPVALAVTRFPGWRVPRSGLVLDALVPAIIEQKVTGKEAFGAQRRLVRRYGEPAPGPWGQRGLMVAPSAQRWRAVPSWEWLKASVDPRRSATVQQVCRLAPALERIATLGPGEPARAALRTIPGVGVWTAAEVAQRALGDPDAVSFGDYHVARSIGWALVGVELDDDALAQLLEPYAGHRYRVQRLLELSGAAHPRRGPRMTLPTHLPR